MTEPEQEPDAGPVVKVSRHLTTILDMHAELLTEAVHSATDPLMPGGEAMVALGPVANLEAWGNLLSASERLSRAYTSAEDEDPDDAWSAFQLIEFWSEAWRRERGEEYDMRPTIVSEASYLRNVLAWAWDNETGWDDFAKDMRRARMRLEDVLYAGERSERGVPCLYDECRAVRLVRKLVPSRGTDGEKTWKLTDWHCPRCKRSWDEPRYAAMVTAAHEASKVELIDGVEWVSDEYAARQVERSVKTIRTWVNRLEVATLCLIVGRRRHVLLSDVERKHADAKRRTSAA